MARAVGLSLVLGIVIHSERSGKFCKAIRFLRLKTQEIGIFRKGIFRFRFYSLVHILLDGLDGRICQSVGFEITCALVE